jgi:hypothetical protein
MLCSCPKDLGPVNFPNCSEVESNFLRQIESIRIYSDGRVFNNEDQFLGELERVEKKGGEVESLIITLKHENPYLDGMTIELLVAQGVSDKIILDLQKIT